MRLLFDIVCMLLISSPFIIEYVKTEKVYKLLGLPLVFYFFVIMPIMTRLNINKNLTLTLIITLIMVIITFYYAYNGLKTSEKFNHGEH